MYRYFITKIHDPVDTVNEKINGYFYENGIFNRRVHREHYHDGAKVIRSRNRQKYVNAFYYALLVGNS